MSSTHPLKFHAPDWHGEARTPVVDGKYCDRTTGEDKLAPDGDHQEFIDPPAVDIIVRSQHNGTVQCAYRASRPFNLETLLCRIMRAVGNGKLELDLLIATPYAIRITLAHELSNEIALDMINGFYDRVP